MGPKTLLASAGLAVALVGVALGLRGLDATTGTSVPEMLPNAVVIESFVNRLGFICRPAPAGPRGHGRRGRLLLSHR